MITIIIVIELNLILIKYAHLSLLKQQSIVIDNSDMDSQEEIVQINGKSLICVYKCNIPYQGACFDYYIL